MICILHVPFQFQLSADVTCIFLMQENIENREPLMELETSLMVTVFVLTMLKTNLK